jgi:hypothetical protein
VTKGVPGRSVADSMRFAFATFRRVARPWPHVDRDVAKGPALAGDLVECGGEGGAVLGGGVVDAVLAGIVGVEVTRRSGALRPCPPYDCYDSTLTP